MYIAKCDVITIYISHAIPNKHTYKAVLASACHTKGQRPSARKRLAIQYNSNVNTNNGLKRKH